MKKLIMAMVAAAALGAFGAEAKLVQDRGRSARSDVMENWTPLAITIAGPVGLPWGFWNVNGLQIGLWNWVEDFNGWQIGVINTTDSFRGWQLGVINVTRKMYGIQVGVVNVIEDNDVPFIPVINWYF